MAKETKIIIRDDIDGSEDAKSYKFGWGDDQYEIDLSDKNAKKLTDFLNEYINVAAKVTARLPRSSGSSSAPKSNKEYLAKVRAWAADNGIEVSSRGRVAQSVVDAYEKAN
ncbi:histone-like nucleoid-structuring protein Lsr2 [Pseudarthrobacter sp. ATCC 49987]|uniref:histone-like nucleoid-structuring protein Lsr2 n=1 Tax=Pseudarthrobacter sp. ATCC 49987 TaxID=2698204 RepID=UPI0013709429|nr:Lsr2 family protein [Pseudarthrobacter sp. ATCC 49987]